MTTITIITIITYNKISLNRQRKNAMSYYKYVMRHVDHIYVM